MDIIVGDFQCCPILCLQIDFFSIDISWWLGQVNAWRDRLYASNEPCYWTYSDPEVVTGELYSFMMIYVQVQIVFSI